MQWYDDLYHSLWLRGRAAAIKRGESVKSQRKGIRITVLGRIIDALLRDGTFASYQDRLICLMLYYAVGRGSEVSTMNFEGLYWDIDDSALWSSWPQLKTGRCTDLSFFTHAYS